MFKELQRKLTLLYTLTTGIILTIVVIAISLISQLNLVRETEENFQSLILNVSTKLQADSSFSVSWIAAMEADNRLLIHIEENGIPLLYRGSWHPKSGRNELLTQAMEEAKKRNTDLSVRPISSASISPIFPLRGSAGDRYQCLAAAYPTANGYKSMLLLYDISSAGKALSIQRLLFAGSGVLGLLALYLAARKFVKNAVKPLQISNQKQLEFIAAASHELRSPLMVIQSSAQGIESVPEKTAQFTKNIIKECGRMSRLIQDMLTLAALSATAPKAVSTHLDLNTLLLDLYELFEPVCLNRKIPFHLNLPGDMLPSIPGNEEQLLQLLSILIDNAISYSHDKSPIILEAALHKSHVDIRVIDHGTGIPDEKKELIFDRFYRDDSSRKDKQHFGLGLSIAKELAEKNNAAIGVSDTPGGGSTFTLKLSCRT